MLTWMDKVKFQSDTPDIQYAETVVTRRAELVNANQTVWKRR